MSPRIPTACLGCGQQTSFGSRCADCSRVHERERHKPYDGPWRARAKRVVDDHRARFGDVCPGYGQPPHPASILAADHVDPIGAGGAIDGPLQVLCTGCNSRKRDGRVNRATGKKYVDTKRMEEIPDA